jgi:hypothetical protein
MAALFPASLPWFTRFVMTPAGQRAATQPPKHYAARSNTTSAWARAEVSWVFFEEHRAAFEDWFRNDLNRGASWALMKLPITPGGIAGDCYSAVRFPSGYSKTLAINGLWRVSAQIVIRDRFECALYVPSFVWVSANIGDTSLEFDSIDEVAAYIGGVIAAGQPSHLGYSHYDNLTYGTGGPEGFSAIFRIWFNSGATQAPISAWRLAD